jgi:carbon storage regulator
MLVLSRQRDETIMIGDDIEITVVDIRGEKVRLGINAPPHVPVHRKEVYEAIKREKQAQTPGADGTVGKVDSLANRKHPPSP